MNRLCDRFYHLAIAVFLIQLVGYQFLPINNTLCGIQLKNGNGNLSLWCFGI